ncbi:hypothetical protein ZIOFF_006152 [Zingiber officinale]|uniref:Phosphoenolpyruvate carboxykinase n=1 Tax=Zingiber officinale TaxID=94328 RepID=A0A8J5HPE8_ZINOF|nr:hypothetical protein ZIOFF_006152 [Zingiber officinale]
MYVHYSRRGSLNIEMDEHTFLVNRERAVDYLNSLDKVFVNDQFLNWDPEHRIKVQIVSARSYHSLFMHNMCIRPTPEELEDFSTPDFTIYNTGQFQCNRYTHYMTTSTSIDLNLDRKEMVILGTQYVGEMKKGLFGVMHYLMPKRNILSLQSSNNMGKDGDVALFFGLSGKCWSHYFHILPFFGFSKITTCMWLTDLTRAKYEVREKTCTRKAKLVLAKSENRNDRRTNIPQANATAALSSSEGLVRKELIVNGYNGTLSLALDNWTQPVSMHGATNLHSHKDKLSLDLS